MSRVEPKRWGRWLAILTLVLLHPSLAAAEEKFSQSPVNPAFEQYQAARQSGMARTMTADGRALGYVPAPLNLEHTAGQSVLIPRPLYGLPVSYDLRTLGKLTAVRDQGSCGSCWTFGAFASLESYLLPGEAWDFSENNLKNTHGFDWGPCDGGNVWISAAYLSRWSGPATEAADPYHPWDDRPSPNVSPVKHAQEVLFLPLRANATDNDTIKQAIMTYGAVTTSFYYNGVYYNSGTYAYYCSGTSYANHEVAIVGWDDNFSKSNFGSTPPGNGAFIVKNSWGTGWGQAGYFYISYYDTQIGMNENAVFENAESTANYARVYQYDPLGWVTSLGIDSTTAWFANVFTAVGAEQLRAVSFYTPSANSSYEIHVYRNPTSPPVGGSPVSSMTGTIAFPGYHTLALTTPVALTAGQKFSVVIKLTTPGYNYPVPVEFAYPGYSSGATAAARQSYLSPNGTSWHDATTWDATCNVCIKAFTVPPGNIIVTPGTLDFGTVTTGMTAQASFTVTNSVGTTVSNGTATVTGGPFTIMSGATFSIPGFGSTNVVVQFAPPSLSGFTNIVVFATANGGNSTNTVTGTGGVLPPRITRQPQSLTVTSGDLAGFSVSASGATPLFYEWQKNGVSLTDGGNIAGATTSVLTLSTAIASDAGDYRVLVANAYGSVTSSVATLTVIPPPMSKFKGFSLHGWYVAAGVGMRNRGFGHISISGIPADSTIKAAYLYWDILANAPDASFSQCQINGQPVAGQLVGVGDCPCWWSLGSSNFAYRADVASFVTGNGTYSLTGFASGITDGRDPFTYGCCIGPVIEGASLIVVYENASIPLSTVLIYEGASETDSILLNAVIDGFVAPDPVTKAQTTFIGADGQSSDEPGSTFNGTFLPTVGWDGSDPQDGPAFSYGNLWDTMTVDVTSLVAPGSSSAVATVQGNPDCLAWVAQVFSIEGLCDVSIVSPPQSLRIASGDPAVFSVTAWSTAPLFYQWQRNGVSLTDSGNVAGATASMLTLSATTDGDTGNYRVIIANDTSGHCSVTSSVATLTVLNPAHLVVNPAGLNFGAVTIGHTNSLNFSVINTGEVSLTGTATLAVAGPFSVTSPPSGGFTVAGGDTQAVTVAFAPSAPVTANGSVIFTSNGGDSTNGVTGVGVCTYALSAYAANSPAKGGTNTVNVITTSSCQWTATTNNTWLTILSGGSGTGAGTLTYVVAPNGSSNARTGTVSIAGLTFTLTQAGNAAPQVTITPVSTVTLPVRTVNLNATATDSDGAPSGTVSTAWSKVSGAGSVTFGNVNAINTTATFSTNGTYVLRLTASDGALSASNNVTVIVNGPPEITSPPAATNALAQVNSLTVAAGNEPVCFTVGMFDPDFNPLYCQWDFGDSATSTDCDPCHVFTNDCGQYAVSVVVSDGIALTNATSLVAIACPMTVSKMRVKLNFAKLNADSTSLSATLDLDAGFSVTNKPDITLDIGGAQVPFTLSAKGRGVSPFGSCKLAYKTKTGLWALKAKLAKGTWRTPWGAHGFENKTVSKPGVWVIMPVVVVIGDDALANERPMLYTAKAGKSGSAK